MEKVRIEGGLALKKAKELLRLQRHDFLNHLQVIHGYLQLNKPEKATDYLMRAIDEIRAQGAALEKELEDSFK